MIILLKKIWLALTTFLMVFAYIFFTKYQNEKLKNKTAELVEEEEKVEEEKQKIVTNAKEISKKIEDNSKKAEKIHEEVNEIKSNVEDIKKDVRDKDKSFFKYFNMLFIIILCISLTTVPILAEEKGQPPPNTIPSIESLKSLPDDVDELRDMVKDMTEFAIYYRNQYYAMEEEYIKMEAKYKESNVLYELEKKNSKAALAELENAVKQIENLQETNKTYAELLKEAMKTGQKTRLELNVGASIVPLHPDYSGFNVGLGYNF